MWCYTSPAVIQEGWTMRNLCICTGRVTACNNWKNREDGQFPTVNSDTRREMQTVIPVQFQT